MWTRPDWLYDYVTDSRPKYESTTYEPGSVATQATKWSLLKIKGRWSSGGREERSFVVCGQTTPFGWYKATNLRTIALATLVPPIDVISYIEEVYTWKLYCCNLDNKCVHVTLSFPLSLSLSLYLFGTTHEKVLISSNLYPLCLTAEFLRTWD